ncbi:MAG: hypothetical protein PHS82_03090 [Lachnospiraceae bacterium]|nr:hypothetical protein [Lachnospiraceae bacterium]
MPKYMDLELNGEVSFRELVQTASDPEKESEDDENASDICDS